MTGENLTPETIVPFLEDIIDRRGAESYLGEEVTMAEHMLQAALLAEQQGEPDELVAAALLHDVGHFTTEFGPYSPADTKDNHHDRAGARILAPFFPPAVTECIRLHVAAKRYLCAKDPAYLRSLSTASVHTLSLQGGAMSPGEADEFEQSQFHREAVRVRICDDQAKVAGMTTRRFRDYTELLRRVSSPSDGIILTGRSGGSPRGGG